MLENVQNIASLSLNGHFLTGATTGIRTPIVQTLPPGALRPPGESNSLELTTTGGEPAVVGRSSSMLGLVVTKSGQRYLAAYSFHNVFAPLAGAVYLLIVAALSAVCPVPGVRSLPIFRTTLNYCVLSSAFLFNLSATVQELMPPFLSTPIHCMLRFSCDWCFATLVLSVYYVKSKWVGVLHAVFGATVVFYGGLACGTIVAEKLGNNSGLLAELAHTSIISTCALTLCGSLIGLFHANSTNRPALERVLSFAGFVTLFSLQARDLLVNLDYEQGSYSSRTYPLVIGLVAAGVLIRRATLLHADERLCAETNAAISRVAGQVAHDIRSPLAALNMVTRNLAQIPEENRVLVREAVNRINEIANSLAFKNVNPASQICKENDEMVDVLELSPLVDVIVDECKIRLPSGRNNDVSIEVGAANYGVFVKAQSAEVKRLLCNLINNGVEAVKSNGKVRVSVKDDDSYVNISVVDDGHGIPAEVIAQLGTRGNTFGKKGGSGLGIYHAKTCLERWGGELIISAGPEKNGTEVIAKFPRAAAPSWHLEELSIPKQTTVVVVDDDESIHEIWRHRFRARELIALETKTVHLDSITKLKRYRQREPSVNTLYLVDLEINGVLDAGSAVIQNLGMERESILVTSRADDIDVKDFCSERGVKLLHKRMAEFLPIREHSIASVPDAILIDDDELIHRVWRMAAKRANRKLLAFRSRDEFVSHVDQIPQTSPVYVDYNLAGKTKGDIVCKELLELGYKFVHISTGADRKEIASIHGITSITGKEPPESWT